MNNVFICQHLLSVQVVLLLYDPLSLYLELQPGEPLADAGAGAVAEGKVGEGMGGVSLAPAPHPPAVLGGQEQCRSVAVQLYSRETLSVQFSSQEI